MPIPKTRRELTDYIEKTYAKLRAELDEAGPRIGRLNCVDDWSVKDLLAVRAWWTHSVVDWVEAGRRGERPVTPAEGYRWKQTPRLNADVIKKCRREPYRSVRRRLDEGYARVLPAIAALTDRELLNVGVFSWAGSYPVARWISLNTARQYTTARTFIRRALQHRVANS